MTHCLTTVIDCTGVVPSARDTIWTEVTQVSRLTVLPDQSVVFREIEPAIRIEVDC
jgi:hypothetical protein